MSSQRHHVLLIGIDAYDTAPLRGCVNDVDAVEAVLLDRLRVPPEAIRKLVAPHPIGPRRDRVPERAPTAERLRDALEALAGAGVAPGDRVLIYYAGHGTRVLPRHARVPREALVPLDGPAGAPLLFDHELNLLLRRIAARTPDLTVILDCCAAAGVTRGGGRPARIAARCVHLRRPSPPPPGPDAGGLLPRRGAADPGYLVAAACQAYETAYEAQWAAGPGHGAFTAGLLAHLAARSDEDLASLRWTELWPALRARLERGARGRPAQHPSLLGDRGRRVFGGPWGPAEDGEPAARGEPPGALAALLALAAGGAGGMSPLRLRVLDAGACGSLWPAELQDPSLPELAADPGARHGYRAQDGQAICVVVESRAASLLHVELVRIGADGGVERLAPGPLDIPPGRRQTFWRGGHLGEPFRCHAARGHPESVDRLLAVGSAEPEVDMWSLAGAAGGAGGWSAAMVTLRIAAG